MLSFAFDLGKPLLKRMDPERAHALTLQALERGLHPTLKHPDHPLLATPCLGRQLTNPVGVAAGFDKDARVADPLLRMGFGFAEVGTLTPLPQEGNPKPRAFRLADDQAIINRNGFNNAGHDAAYARLAARKRVGCVGINLGANKDSVDRVADYVLGLTRFFDLASYFMINISSPNTPGLRDLQAPQAINALLSSIFQEMDRLADRKGRAVPVALKLAPDIARSDLEPICDQILKHPISAIAIANTTIARPSTLRSDRAFIAQAGGLSGPPLFVASTVMLARVHQLTGGKVPLIGIGGIDSGATAVDKIRAGATLIQMYTGLVYRGPELLPNIKDALVRAAQADGGTSLAGLVGSDRQAWLDKGDAIDAG